MTPLRRVRWWTAVLVIPLMLAACDEFVPSAERAAATKVLSGVGLPPEFVLQRQSYLGNTPDVPVWTYVGPAGRSLKADEVQVPEGFTRNQRSQPAQPPGAWTTLARWTGPSPNFSGVCTLRLDEPSQGSGDYRVQVIASCVRASPSGSV